MTHTEAIAQLEAQGKTITVCPPQKAPKQYCFASSSRAARGVKKSVTLKNQSYYFKR